MQFGELKRELSGISAKMLTEHLRQLESDNIINHRVEKKGRVKISHYEYTEYGSSLVPVLDLIGEWGVQHDKSMRKNTQ